MKTIPNYHFLELRNPNKYDNETTDTLIQNLAAREVSCLPLIIPPLSTEHHDPKDAIKDAITYYSDRNVEKIIALPYYIGLPCILYLNENIGASFFVLSDGTIMDILSRGVNAVENILISNKGNSQMKSIHSTVDWSNTTIVAIEGVLKPYAMFDHMIPLNVDLAMRCPIDDDSHIMVKTGHKAEVFRAGDFIMRDSEALQFFREYKFKKQGYLIGQYGIDKYNRYRRIFYDPFGIDRRDIPKSKREIIRGIFGSEKKMQFEPMFWRAIHAWNEGRAKYQIIPSTNYLDSSSFVNPFKKPIRVGGGNNKAEVHRVFNFAKDCYEMEGVGGIIIMPEEINKINTATCCPAIKIRNHEYLQCIYSDSINQNDIEILRWTIEALSSRLHFEQGRMFKQNPSEFCYVSSMSSIPEPDDVKASYKLVMGNMLRILSEYFAGVDKSQIV